MTGPRHGTVNGYNKIPCREACCRDAYARWRKEWKHNLRHGHVRVIDVTGSRRRVQALIALGWSVRNIAERLGGTEMVVTHILTRPTITAAKAKRVAQVFDQMSMRLPPDTTPDERRAISRSRNRAAREGWVTPLAWDDDIDNPDATPYRPSGTDRGIDEQVIQLAMSGQRVIANAAERAEVIRRWKAAGRPINELDRLMGWNARRTARRAA